jgi:hypothetical protein
VSPSSLPEYTLVAWAIRGQPLHRRADFGGCHRRCDRSAPGLRHLGHGLPELRQGEAPYRVLGPVLPCNAALACVPAECIIDILVDPCGPQGILEAVPERMEDAGLVRDAKPSLVVLEPLRPRLSEASL